MAGKTQVLDMTGRRFGFLTVIRREGSYRKTTQAAWLCRCDCGSEKVVGGDNLRRGLSKSCGCQQHLGPTPTHGLTDTPIYSIWQGMFARCYNPRNPAYKHYGGRGIRVCERWSTVENFVADMGSRPAGLTLDRIDNDSNYEPTNCRWATRRQQANNTRRNVIIPTSHGNLTFTELARLAGISKTALYYRLSRGLKGDQLLAPGHNGRSLSMISSTVDPGVPSLS